MISQHATRHTGRDTKASVAPRYVAIIAVSVIIVSLASLYFTQLRPTNKTNFAPFIGVGQVLADETAKTISDTGRVVLLVSDSQRDPNSIEHHQLDGFSREIKSHRQIQIVATESFKVEAPSIADATREPGITNEQFAELLRKYDDADALVAFIELPDLNPDRPLNWPRVYPKIIAAQMAMQVGQACLRDKTIVAFIAKREDAPANIKPHTPREWFAKYFQVFTLQNLDSQPQASEALQ